MLRYGSRFKSQSQNLLVYGLIWTVIEEIHFIWEEGASNTKYEIYGERSLQCSLKFSFLIYKLMPISFN
jgi:hypothetical protein